jgi:primase-polymerase (primpol)-like protein
MNGFIVPDALAERDRWVMWRREQGTKVPYRVDNRRASITNPSDWSDYTIATNDATVGKVIGPVMMSQLPLNDRDYLQLADRQGPAILFWRL